MNAWTQQLAAANINSNPGRLIGQRRIVRRLGAPPLLLWLDGIVEDDVRGALKCWGGALTAWGVWGGPD